ncbi:unnamed protein product [Prunus brigantina]
MSSPKIRASGSSSSVPPDYITGAGVDDHAIEVHISQPFIASSLEYRHLAEAPHNHTDVGLGPTASAHLFKNLVLATPENPLNLSRSVRVLDDPDPATGLLPELRFPDVVLARRSSSARPLMAAKCPSAPLKNTRCSSGIAPRGRQLNGRW